jgi:uncharacterized membrane protein
MRLSDAVTIDAPIAAVFDGWADLERSPEHQAATIDRTKLTEGPVAAGTRFSAVDQWPGRRVEFETAITVFERPTRIGARWDQPMNGSWVARFEDLSGRTRMDFETTIEPGGLLGVLALLMKLWAKRQLRGGLESFRSWVEASETVRSS